jgi:WD40 repeat protein
LSYKFVAFIFLTDDIFASASLDGTVKLWKTDSLLSYRYFNSENEEYQGAEKTFPYSVDTMLCLKNVSCDSRIVLKVT